MSGLTQIFTGNNCVFSYKIYEEGDNADATYESVNEMNSLGDLSDSANVIDVPAFGEAYTRSIAGQKTAGPVDMTLNWTPADTQHAALYQAYAEDTKLSFKLTAKKGDAETYLVFGGFLSSHSTSFPLDGVVTAVISIAVDGGYTLSHKA